MFLGGVWPVVHRELRASARWPLGPWLRAGGALGGIAVFCALYSVVQQVGAGSDLFHNLHILLLWLICLLVPALTADCLARERREGTLGLLFMTPLTASGIVLGKTMAQVLRALTLWLALLPILSLPFLSGGVGWPDYTSCLAAELCAGLLCLAAGILASSLTDNRALTFVVSYLLMVSFIGAPAGYRFSALKSPFATEFIQQRVTWYPRPGSGKRPQWAHRLLPPVPTVVRSVRDFAKPLAEKLAAAAVVLLVALRFAGWRVETSWQDKVPSERQKNWIRRYCTPLFARWFADRMRRTKEWNPIAWLQQYSWKARISKWGLCLLFVLLECFAIDGSQPFQLTATVVALMVVMAGAYTYAGVNGFLEERRSGALELILVSPISVKQIILGRVWGLWKQFLPSVLLVVASDIAVRTMIPDMGFDGFWVVDVEIIAIYLTMPIFATFCALRIKNLFLAATLTWMALLVSPVIGLMLTGMIGIAAGVAPPTFFLLPVLVGHILIAGILVGHILTAGLVVAWLNRNLQHRSYAFH